MRRIAFIVLAALALGIGVWFLIRPDETSRGRPVDETEPRARPNADGAAALMPVLVGQATRPAVPATESNSVPPAEGDAAPPAAAEVATEDPSPMGELIRRIQREVEPSTWTPPGEGAMKPQCGRNLVVKAPRAVQEGIAEFLEELREAGLRELLVAAGDEPAPTPIDPAGREAGEEELRRLLRAILAQWKRLEGALRAREENRVADALRLIDEVLAHEPDHGLALEYRKVLLAPPAPEPRLVDLDDAGCGLEPRRGPYEAVESRIRWPIRIRIPAHVVGWPSPTTFAALDRARRRALMRRWTFTGPERERRLKLRAPTLRLEGLDLFEALQQLSVETLIDLSADSTVTGRPLPRLQPVDATLGALLQAIASALGPNLRFTPYATVLELAAEGQVSGLECRIFDVSEVLDGALEELPR
jgi:hypothetical protein